MAYEFLKVRVAERVGWLQYHRPPVNAFNWQMLREVPRALRALLDDPGVRVIVFASALDTYFTAGADIRVMQAMDQAAMREWVQFCHALVRQMRAAPKPLLAAINGTAVGGGLEMVLNCDVRFAAADARLGQPEINIAFIPPVGATQSLARLLGRPRALRYLYEGTLLSAPEAHAIGLVDFVVPAEQLHQEAQAYALTLTRKPAEALAAIRHCVTAGIEVPFGDGLAIELEAAAHLAGTADFREGLEAFLEKRPARWA
ncbi:MAG: enoyl-CoA hydratase/isomerase family protein [Candidatus Rokubacteria bacterium]|nr:enoyl-CoA hydratase/isomerase family protein [Candidatus Rokubacteria bacterium]